MNVRLIHVEIKSRLNKLDSSDYDNIQCYQINRAFNKAQLDWCRRQLMGKNQAQTAAEQTTQRVHDLQALLVNIPTTGTNYHSFYETKSLPKDILRFEKISAKGRSGSCKDKLMTLDFIEEGNVGFYLKDWSMKPSFDWATSFYTMLSNKVRIYHDGEFDVVDPEITYYRTPKEISLLGCENIFGQDLGDIDPEFNDDIVEILIDEAVSILAGDIESFNVLGTTKERKEYNT